MCDVSVTARVTACVLRGVWVWLGGQDARATNYALDMKAQSAARFEVIRGKLRTLLKPLGHAVVRQFCTLVRWFSYAACSHRSAQPRVRPLAGDVSLGCEHRRVSGRPLER